MFNLEEKQLIDWLKSIDIPDKYIYKIKVIFNEEGIKFCCKTMNCFTIEDIKKSVEQMKDDEDKEFLTCLISDCPGVKVDEVVDKLMIGR